MTKSAAQHKLLTLNFLTRSGNALTTKIHKAVPPLSGGRVSPPRRTPCFCHYLLDSEGGLDIFCVCDCISCRISLLPLLVSTYRGVRLFFKSLIIPFRGKMRTRTVPPGKKVKENRGWGESRQWELETFFPLYLKIKTQP